MVVKKYLCAAPRPESWKEKAEALLKSLGGDKAKCKLVASQTLTILKERHKHEKKRTGPGRKSNAEHAIAFYEYLAGDKEIGYEENDANVSSDSSDDESSSSEQSSESNTVNTEEFLNQHDDACDVCNLGGELICCSTCSLVFHQECLRPVMKTIPSGWICPYCITDGVNNFKRHSKTWKSAASGIRQMKRLREELEIGSQETNEKDKNETKKGEKDNTPAEESTERAETEESPREKRTKLENEESLTSDDKSSPVGEEKGKQKKEAGQEKSDDQGNSSLKESKGGNTSACSSVSSVGAVSDSKRNLALYKIADSYSNSTENLVVRGRRQRKQPTLYQPQLCADSRWKSDEKHLETGSSDSDASDTNSSDTENESRKEDTSDSKGRHRNPRRVLKKKKTRKSKNEPDDDIVICIVEDDTGRKKTGSPFCNFCHDDPSIPICVFCGCRKCFGKHQRSTLLLCDDCDDEYHVQCLGLKTVPSAKQWFCPACAKTKSDSKLPSTRRATAAIALGNGSESDNSKRNSPNKQSRMSKKVSDVEVFAKRTRGRPSRLRVESESTPGSPSPRKSLRTPKAAVNSKEVTEQRKRGRSATTPSTGRKRGRPPKNISTTTPTLPSKSSPSPSPRKRGRPPKASPELNISSSKVDAAARKKVLKPSTPSSNTSSKPEVPTKAPEPIKVSRVSGRTVKRASFHDEVDEGEQHLRSSKSPQSGESQSTNQTSKIGVTKSQESQVHRSNSKTPDKSEASRKKQKLEEKTTIQTKATPSEKTRKAPVVKVKDEDMGDTPPIAPVRMKPVLEPPAPPIAPVRMKPVLQPPTPGTRPPISIPENSNVAKKLETKPEDVEKSIVEIKEVKEKTNETNSTPANAKHTAPTEQTSKKLEGPPSTLIPPNTNKPGATVASKAAIPKSANPRASPTVVQEVSNNGTVPSSSIASTFPSTPLLDPVALDAAVKALPEPKEKKGEKKGITKTPRRKPGARECMQISRRFGVDIIPEKYMTILLDYCHRGKVEHLIKMRERLDCHSRFLEYQLAGLEARVKEVGESNVVVPAMPLHKRDSSSRHRGGGVSPTPLSLYKTHKTVAATPAPGKKQIVGAQASGVAALKQKIENTTTKLPTKQTAGPTPPTPMSIPPPTKPSLPLPVGVAKKPKTQ